MSSETSQSNDEGTGTGSLISDIPGNAPKGNPKITAIGHAVWLMTHSPIHKHLFMIDIEWLVIPAVSLNQYHLWQKDGTPAGFASWAFLGEEAEARMKQGIRRIMPVDWKSGDNLWLMDFITPFGNEQEMLKELKEKVFGGKPMKSLQPAPGGGMGVVEW